MFSPRQITLLAAATCCISWSVLTPAHAAPYTSLVIFGDSLSDVGNIASSSFDIYPGKYYYEDRFSNGPVWVETLATSLGLPATKRSTASGDDFAYGGAQTTGTGGLEGAFIRDIDEQVTQYLNQRTIDPTALYVVFAGSNDFINGQTNVATPANRLATDISRLITAGARNFLVPNLPLLGATPRFNGNPTTAAVYNDRSQQFNATMDAKLFELSDDVAELTFFRLDVASLFADAIAHPTKFGLTNVTTPAAPGLQSGASSYNTSLIAPNANEYLFWDDLHPTTTVHTVLAARARALVDGVPGDFNADAFVDAADLAIWQSNVGAAGSATRATGDANGDQLVDGADFLLWQLNATSSAAFAAVPEPAPWRLALASVLAAALCTARGRCFNVPHAAG
ncbi:SGNH/GDSL hydrolase family protein [Lacipirellula limnantheis]|uniref:Phosphatidylcholine-sterol acyltransferase n=1 Tax=Lacipirellula limnantheis TaxID=2528024 RepID=A0A517U024_9BACT|nr:SGNH/GDSL hydrolase family protein [Lacipirellula limnantheis]QDT73961.1 Phosphatidylcholine-sterol acyltransferase precursor [Lacipirellula limnantheis]